MLVGRAAAEHRELTVCVCACLACSAAEMLEALQLRMPNEPADELRVAAAEQAKITRIRLEKLEL
jgi:2-oxo-4-hydroxy-4-carboxy-5-ureidoimidazoline decarboxylase